MTALASKVRESKSRQPLYLDRGADRNLQEGAAGPSSPASGRSPKVGTATARTEIPHLVGNEGASVAATGGARQHKHSR